jgi:hypothetical protein
MASVPMVLNVYPSDERFVHLEPNSAQNLRSERLEVVVSCTLHHG